MSVIVVFLRPLGLRLRHVGASRQRCIPVTAMLIFEPSVTEYSGTDIGNIGIGCYEIGTPVPTTRFAAEQLGQQLLTGRMDANLWYGVELNSLEVPSNGFKIPVGSADNTPQALMAPCNLFVFLDTGLPVGTVVGTLKAVIHWKFWDPYLGPTMRTGRRRIRRTGHTSSAPNGTTEVSSASYGILSASGFTIDNTTLVIPGLLEGDTLRVDWLWNGSATGVAANPIVTVTNGVNYSIFAGGTISTQNSPTTGTVTSAFLLSYGVQYTGPAGGNLTIALGTSGVYPTGTTTVDITIEALPVGVPSSAL